MPSTLMSFAQSLMRQEIASENRRFAKIQKEKEDFTFDPKKADKMVADFQRTAVPDEALIKLPASANLAKVQSKIPKGDPRRELGTKVVQEFNRNLPNLPEGISPREYLAGLYSAYGEVTKEDVYKFKQKEESSLPGFKTFPKVADPVDYELWKEAFEGEPVPIEFTDPRVSAGIGAAFGAGAVAFKKFVRKQGGKQLMSRLAARVLPAAGPWGVAASVGLTALTAIPEFAAFDVATGAVRKTSFGKQREIKSSLIGAGATAAGTAALAKLGRKLLPVTAAKEAVDETAKIASTSPTAKNIVDLGKRSKAAEQAEAKYGKFVLSELESGNVDLASAVALKLSEGDTSAIMSLIRQGKSEGQAVAKVVKEGVAREKKTGIAKVAQRLAEKKTRMEKDLEKLADPTSILAGEGTISERVKKALNAQKQLDELANPKVPRGKVYKSAEQQSLSAELKSLGYSDEAINAIPVRMRKKLSKRGAINEKRQKALRTINKVITTPARQPIAAQIVQRRPSLTRPIRNIGVTGPGKLRTTAEEGVFIAEEAEKASVISAKKGAATRKAAKEGIGKPEDFTLTPGVKQTLRTMGMTEEEIVNVPSQAIRAMIKDNALAKKQLISEGEKSIGLTQSERALLKTGDLTAEEFKLIEKYRPVVTSAEEAIHHPIVGIQTEAGLLGTKEFKGATNVLIEDLNSAGATVDVIEQRNLFDAVEYARTKLGISGKQGAKRAEIEKAYSEFTKRIQSTVDKQIEREGKEVNSTAKKLFNQKTTEEQANIAMTSEADAIAADLLNQQRKDFIKERVSNLKNKGLIGLAGTALIPIATAFSSEEAEAFNVAKLPGLVVEPMINAAKNATKRTRKQMVDAMVKEKIGYTPGIDPANPTVLPTKANGFYVSANISDITRKKELSFGAHNYLTPYTQNRLIYSGTDAAGNELLNNPMPQLAMATAVANVEGGIGIKVVDNILAKHGVDNSPKITRKIAEEMSELQALTEVPVHEAGFHTFQLGVQEDAFKVLEKASRKSKGRELEANLATLEKLTKENAETKTALTDVQEILKGHGSLIDAKHRELAGKYSTSRVALALDGVGMTADDPWLRNMLSENELAAVAETKEVFEQYALRMIDAGQTPMMGDYFVHHAIHPKRDVKKINKALAGISLDPHFSYPLSKFHRRAVFSKQMMPDISYISKMYFPDAARRIEFGHFWNSGWKKHVQQVKQTGWRGPIRFWENVEDAMKPIEDTPANKIFRTLYSFEVARLIGFSPSVAFKHAIKLEANWSNFGLRESIPLLPASVSKFTRGIVNDTYSKATGKALPKDLETDLMKTFVSYNRMTELLTEMEVFDLPGGVVDKWINAFNKKGSVFVAGVERFDRGHSFLAALEMAGKKGMTPAQAAYGVMDTILKTNFLSGIQNPNWIRDPKIRFMAMFQATPFKIAEQRLLLGIKSGRAVSATQKATMEEFKNLRSAVKEGEMSFKYNVIMDALGSQRDIFGTPLTAQLARKMLVLGGIIGTGHVVFDADMWDHVAHPPFTKLHEKSISLGLNPIMSAGLESWGRREEEDRDMWVTEFMGTWLQGKGVPINIRKAMRLSRDDIPARYRGSKYKFFFGVPAEKEK